MRSRQRPPRLARALLRLLTRDDPRAELLHELDREYGERVAEAGRLRAIIGYWREILNRDLLRLRRSYREAALAGAGSPGTRAPADHGARLDLLGLELRQALRSIRRRPAGSLAFVALLALCVATTAVVLALVDGIVRRPAPYPDADDIVLVGPRWLDGREPGGNVSAGEYVDLSARSAFFVVAGALEATERTLLGDGPPVELPGAYVTASAFDALEVPAALGRTFSAEESRPGGDGVLVLSDELWRGAFGADPTVLGAQLRLDDRRYEIVGVMPPGFVLPTEIGAAERSAFFLPLVVDASDPGPYFVKDFDAVVARIRRGASVSAVTADVERIAAEIIAEHADNYHADEWTLRVYSPVEEAVARTRPLLRLLTLAVGFLVLAVGANLAGMLGSRIEEQRPAIVLRAALGAGRAHLVRSMLVEALVLAGVGGLAGVVASGFVLPLATRSLEGSLPRLREVHVDLRVAAVSIGIAMLAALVFSLVPALRTHAGAAVLNASGLRVAAGRSGFRRALIGSQLALASVLVCGSLLFVRSLVGLVRTDPGFVSAGVETVELSLPSARYATVTEIESFYRRLLQQLQGAAGVQAVGLARRRPMADRYGTWSAAIRAGGEPRRLDDAPPRWQVVTPGYFDAMSIRLEEGRIFDSADLSGPAGVAVVNAAFERAYWPGRSAVDTEIRMDGGPGNPWLRIVGVVADVATGGPRQAAVPVLYVPQAHFDEATSMGTPRSMALVLRTTLDTAGTRSLVQARIRRMDPDLPVGALRSMDSIVAATRADTRILTQILVLFAALTLALGALGVYGTLAQEVAARRKELGIRAALGAGRGRLLRAVVWEGLLLAAAGCAVGLVAFYSLASLIGSHLFGVEARDPATFAVVAGVLLVSTALAAYTPAQRAAAADPVTALRAE